MKKHKLISVISSFILLTPQQTLFAAEGVGNFLPGSIEPGVIGKQLSTPPIQAPAFRQPQVTHPEQKAQGLGPEAAKVKFKLTKIILDGNHVYSEKQLAPIYQSKLNTTISVADLQQIVQDITNYYRNNGYILTRAVLPPQHVVNGVVHIEVVEGYISGVDVQGNPKKAKCMLLKYGEHISEVRPTQIKVMEYYLRLANELPGVTAKSVLEPSKKVSGASDMTLVGNTKTLSGYISYDDYGTRYIGPQQFTGSISANSIFQSGDSTHLTSVRTAKPYELNYTDLSHEFPMGTKGMRGSIGGNSSRTFPKYVLSPLQIDGDAVNFYGVISQPIIRARDQDLTLNGGVNYIDSGSNAFSTMLYDDHIRSANVGFNYDSSDSWAGSNLIGAHIEQGFNILGASNNPTSPHNSRFGADGIYTKVTGNVGRLQRIKGPLSIFFYTTGQYSWEPLLATAET